MKAKNAFLRLFSRSAGKVHVAGEFVSMPTHVGKESDAAKMASAAQMHVAGSMGLKRLPIASESDFAKRREKAFQYDFAAIG